MPTQAEIRVQRKTRVRRLRASLRKLDTQHEVLERRLDRMLEVEREVSFKSFDSFIKNKRVYDRRLRDFELVMAAIIGLFLVD